MSIEKKNNFILIEYWRKSKNLIMRKIIRIMKFILFLLLSFFILQSCGNIATESDSAYRLTAHSFLRLMKEEKLDSAKSLVFAYNDTINFNNEIRLIRYLMIKKENIPSIESYILDSLNYKHAKFRSYEIPLFENNINDDPDKYLGTIYVSFADGIPEKISIIGAIGKPTRFQ